MKATPSQLVSSYNSFVAHTIDLDEPSTLVYIRGKQRDGSQSIVTLRAVPNELVLWPQVWGSAKVIGQTGFELDETINHNQGMKQSFYYLQIEELTPNTISRRRSCANFLLSDPDS